MAEGTQRSTPIAFLIPTIRATPRGSRKWWGGCSTSTSKSAVRTAPINSKKARSPAGTYVVRLDQPYRNYAVDLLTPQHYPKDGSEPYDDVSWESPHYRS